MTAAVCKLGLPADPAGRGVVLVLGLLAAGVRPDAPHFLFVALELLVQRPVGAGERRRERERERLRLDTDSEYSGLYSLPNCLLAKCSLLIIDVIAGQLTE